MSTKHIVDTLAARMTKEAAPRMIPNHGEGAGFTRCSHCAQFTLPRPSLPLFDRGVDVHGRCELFSDYTSARMVCSEFQSGEPDVR